jgi:hypothetical protein
VFGLDTTDLTSTTTGLDSMMDGNTENNSSDDDISTTIDITDAHAIRKQLEGLENMYSEVSQDDQNCAYRVRKELLHSVSLYDQRYNGIIRLMKE